MNQVLNTITTETKNFTKCQYNSVLFGFVKIRTIDGVKVICNIIYTFQTSCKKIDFYLKIHQFEMMRPLYSIHFPEERIDLNDREFYEPEFINTFKSVLRKSYSIISKLKYVSWLPYYSFLNGYCDGLIDLETLDGIMVLEDIFNEYKSSLIENEVKLNIHKTEDCPVCFNPTIHKTICGHHLCYRCFDKIKKIFEENEEYKIKPCPICRCDIDVEDNNNDEESDEESDKESDEESDN